MNIINYPLDKGQWVATRTIKKYVVWHATEGRTKHTPYNGQPGRATTSIDSWNASGERVGAPWLIDRDGTIYKTFDDSEWIYHLGLKDPSYNGYYDRVSVPIELANECGLWLNNDKAYAFDRIDPNTIYDGDREDIDWKDYNHLAAFDKDQIHAAIELTLDICNRFKISPTMLRTDKYDPTAWQKANIIRHTHVRADKTDLWLPDWAWDMIGDSGIKLVE